ncbi:MAG: 2OG-Fe(II) oxygenase [SAR324 cluster bacterium]|nr:2OG-Fe(II) oxygenase [SAR324 cluster bacterium]
MACNKQWAQIITDLTVHGWSVQTDFVSRDLVGALKKTAENLWQENEFKKAGVGRQNNYLRNPEIRSDYIFWMDEVQTPDVEEWNHLLDNMKAQLNRELFLGLEEVESMFAIYPPGAFYARHRDRFADNDQRTISCVLYLNETWSGEDGGTLRIHADEKHFVDVPPEAGTCAIFRSDTILHEVLPANRQRFSVTNWFRRRPLL